MKRLMYEGMDLCQRCGRLAFWREEFRVWLCWECWQRSPCPTLMTKVREGTR